MKMNDDANPYGIKKANMNAIGLTGTTASVSKNLNSRID